MFDVFKESDLDAKEAHDSNEAHDAHVNSFPMSNDEESVDSVSGRTDNGQVSNLRSMLAESVDGRESVDDQKNLGRGSLNEEGASELRDDLEPEASSFEMVDVVEPIIAVSDATLFNQA
jgi:hypothetical protein